MSESSTPNKNEPVVVLVGHCGPDTWMLRSTVERIVPEAQIEQVNSASDLNHVLDRARVLLVNRVLDGAFEGESGIELIQRLAGEKVSAAMLLISNYDDAQEEAVAAGARRGFGKSALYDNGTAETLRAAIQHEQ